jgi:hypothetical protein
MIFPEHGQININRAMGTISQYGRLQPGRPRSGQNRAAFYLFTLKKSGWICPLAFFILDYLDGEFLLFYH